MALSSLSKSSFFSTSSSQKIRSVRYRWIRLVHRMQDVVTIVAFSLYPLDSLSTTLRVGGQGGGGSNNTRSNGNNGNNNTTSNNTKCLTIEQWTSLGSGGFVWDGSRRLMKYLESTYKYKDKDHHQHHHHHHSQNSSTATTTNIGNNYWNGRNVIELGAGTGALGLGIAALGANVTLTDQASFVFPEGQNRREQIQARSLLDLMRLNVQNNVHYFDYHYHYSNNDNNDNNQQYCQQIQQHKQHKQESIKVCEMLWGDNNHKDSKIMHDGLPHSTYDMILASDVLLFQSAQQDLLTTIRQLSNPQTIIYIEHTDRSSNGSGSSSSTSSTSTSVSEDDNGDDGGTEKETETTATATATATAAGYGYGYPRDHYPKDLLNFLELLKADTQVTWYPKIVLNHGRHMTLRITQVRQDNIEILK